jgi:hypothetical protein
MNHRVILNRLATTVCLYGIACSSRTAEPVGQHVDDHPAASSDGTPSVPVIVGPPFDASVPASGETEMANLDSGLGPPLPTPDEPVPLAATTPEPFAYDPWVDDRPLGPDWAPSLPLGDPGWNKSVDPFCSPFDGRGSDTLWGDGQRLYFYERAECKDVEAHDCGHTGASATFNDGAGWQPLFISSLSSAPVLDLIGVFSTGTAVFEGISHDIVFVDGAGASPVLSFESGASPSAAFQVAESDVVYLSVPTQLGDTIAPSTLYAVTPHDSTRLGSVSQSIDGIWANSERAVFVAGDEAAILEYSIENKSFRAISDVPGKYWQVWGLGARDLWLSEWPTTLVHFDGESWDSLETGLHDPIEQIWGAEDTLYLRTNTEFARVTPAGIEVILTQGANLTVHSMWGRSASEVFLSIEDYSYKQFRCGGTFVVRFDGKEFHVM